MRGLLNVVQDYSWELNGGSKMSVYLNAVSLLSAMSQVCLFPCNHAVNIFDIKACTYPCPSFIFQQEYFIYHIDKGMIEVTAWHFLSVLACLG